MNHGPLNLLEMLSEIYTETIGDDSGDAWVCLGEDFSPIIRVDAGVTDRSAKPQSLIHACYAYRQDTGAITCYVELTIKRRGELLYFGPLENYDTTKLSPLPPDGWYSVTAMERGQFV